MKSSDILLDVDYYVDHSSDWRDPKYGEARSEPMRRVDLERYEKPAYTYAYRPSQRGTHIKMQARGAENPTYVRAAEVRGPWEPLRAEVAANVAAREAIALGDRAARQAILARAKLAVDRANALLAQGHGWKLAVPYSASRGIEVPMEALEELLALAERGANAGQA